MSTPRDALLDLIELVGTDYLYDFLDKSGALCQRITNDTTATPEALEQISAICSQHLGMPGYQHVLLSVGQHPNCTADQMRHVFCLLESVRPKLSLTSLLLNPVCPADVLEHIVCSTSADWLPMRSLVQHPSITLRTVLHLMEDGIFWSFGFKQTQLPCLLRNPNCGPDILHEIVERAPANGMGYGFLRTVLRHPLCSEETLWVALRQGGDGRLLSDVVRHPNCSPTLAVMYALAE